MTAQPVRSSMPKRNARYTLVQASTLPKVLNGLSSQWSANPGDLLFPEWLKYVADEAEGLIYGRLKDPSSDAMKHLRGQFTDSGWDDLWGVVLVAYCGSHNSREWKRIAEWIERELRTIQNAMTHAKAVLAPVRQRVERSELWPGLLPDLSQQRATSTVVSSGGVRDGLFHSDLASRFGRISGAAKLLEDMLRQLGRETTGRPTFIDASFDALLFELCQSKHLDGLRMVASWVCDLDPELAAYIRELADQRESGAWPPALASVWIRVDREGEFCAIDFRVGPLGSNGSIDATALGQAALTPSDQLTIEVEPSALRIQIVGRGRSPLAGARVRVWIGERSFTQVLIPWGTDALGEHELVLMDLWVDEDV